MGRSTLAYVTFALTFCLGVSAEVQHRSKFHNRLSDGKYMNCSGTTLCGVLTVESGFGQGYYSHKKPAVHGLWPEVGGFGSSSCISPKDTTPPQTLFPCYQGTDTTHQLSFEQHEWSKHGICSGTQNASDFFGQVCALAEAPLSVMAKTRAAGVTDTSVYAQDLTQAGYAVWATMENGQVELSACARPDGRWVLGAVADFVKLCGSGPPAPPPSPSSDKCVPSVHGPACHMDSDCTNYTGCKRCAHSGFCTDVPQL